MRYHSQGKDSVISEPHTIRIHFFVRPMALSDIGGGMLSKLTWTSFLNPLGVLKMRWWAHIAIFFLVISINLSLKVIFKKEHKLFNLDGNFSFAIGNTLIQGFLDFLI